MFCIHKNELINKLVYMYILVVMDKFLEVKLLGQNINTYVVLFFIAKFPSKRVVPVCILINKILYFKQSLKFFLVVLAQKSLKFLKG